MKQIAGRIERDTQEKIVATLGEFQGEPGIDIRTYSQLRKDPGKWRPSKI